MSEAFEWLAERLLSVTLPMMLGIVILMLTFFRWLSRKR